MASTLVKARLAGHGFVRPRFDSVVELVKAYGCVQAQDYAAASWAVGMRLTGAPTRAMIDLAIAEGSVVRTHPLRSTIHLVAREDVRWILGLTAERMLTSWRSRLAELGLDGKTLVKSVKVLAKALAGGALTRAELATALQRGGVATDGQRFIYMMGYAELICLVTSGPFRDGKQTFALFDERIPPAPARPRDEAAAELARRYLAMRRPATLADFTWWSGLAVAEARAAFATIDAAEDHAPVSATGTYLLPAFDEYTVAYKDRGALIPPGAALDGFALLSPVIVDRGMVVGKWRRTVDRKAKLTIELAPIDAAFDRRRLAPAAERLRDFLGATTVIVR